MSGTNMIRLAISLPEFLVEDSDGWVHFQGRRVGLSSLIAPYRDGYSPETLAAEYPMLSLATIHKTIAFYLEHQGAIDRYLSQCASHSAQRINAQEHGPSLEELRYRLVERALAK